MKSRGAWRRGFFFGRFLDVKVLGGTETNR